MIRILRIMKYNALPANKFFIYLRIYQKSEPGV